MLWLTRKMRGIPASQRIPLPARWILASVLVSNIGNGMNTLTVSMLLYVKTGSAAAFGASIILQYVVTFLVQVFAGSIVDRGDPKKVAVYCDLLRGVGVCAASLMLNTPYVYWCVFGSIILINALRPFYRSATFVVGPLVAPGPALVKYNAYCGSLLQSGQLMGVALVGIILQRFGSGFALGLDGVSYLLSGLAIWMASIPMIDQERKASQSKGIEGFLHDWKEILQLLRSNLALSCHVVLCCADYIAVSCVNLLLVPIVAVWYSGNTYWLSALDGGFAAGSILAGLITAQVISKLGTRTTTVFGLTGQSILFLSLSLIHISYIAILFMFLIGCCNTFSITAFTSGLQHRTDRSIQGRIAGVRYLLLSILTSAVVPVVSFMQNLSLEKGLFTVAGICITFSLATLLLSSRHLLGYTLFGTSDKS
jgi:hypothetical protein